MTSYIWKSLLLADVFSNQLTFSLACNICQSKQTSATAREHLPLLAKVYSHAGAQIGLWMEEKMAHLERV